MPPGSTTSAGLVSEGEEVAEGALTVAFIDRSTGRAAPWPAPIREQLATAGLVEESFL